MARQVRNLTLSYREREFVLASRALGENKFKIAFKHVLPNISGIIIVHYDDRSKCYYVRGGSISYQFGG